MCFDKDTSRKYAIIYEGPRLGMLQFKRIRMQCKIIFARTLTTEIQRWDSVINGVDKRGLLNFLKRSYHVRSFEIHKGVQRSLT